MSDNAANAPVLAADGRPLKRSLARALRVQKLRALALIAPLLAFVLISFIFPIGDMLFRSVENQMFENVMPNTMRELQVWDAKSDELPPEAVFRAAYFDLSLAAEAKRHTRLGSRMNYESTGMSSLFRQAGRKVDDLGKAYRKDFKEVDERWSKPETWLALMSGADDAEKNTALVNEQKARLARLLDDSIKATPEFVPGAEVSALLPQTAQAYTAFAISTELVNGKNLLKVKPHETLYAALADDLQVADLAGYDGPQGDALRALADSGLISAPDFTTAFAEMDKGWADIETWRTFKVHGTPYTSGYFLNAVDMQKTVDGPAVQPENKRILIKLFVRTLIMSLTIMGACILLGYPVAWLLANLPMGKANVLMIFVLLPFWTSLLVRTSAWKVMLQQQGVINDVLVWVGLVDDANRLVMINNQFGTIIAMTHILLPFMILPMYSVMQTINPSYVRAAKSLGATDWTSFWRVYFPQSIPGIGAGSILVFILSIGYYITPEIVGGTKGVFISNRIAYHISSSLNWGLAAALGTILLMVVLGLYWCYDKIVGIDNVKLG